MRNLEIGFQKTACGTYVLKMVSIKFSDALEARIRVKSSSSSDSVLAQRQRSTMDKPCSVSKESRISSNLDRLNTQEVIMTTTCSTEIAALADLVDDFDP